MKTIIIGCGRLGAELALSIASHDHQVVVVDRSAKAFQRLGSTFHGRTVLGDVLHQNVLLRADIEQADALAAVTPDDLTNLIAARTASQIYHLPNVVARVYDPRRRSSFENLGVQAVASTSWGAQRVEYLLTHPGIATLATTGHGEVTIIETHTPQNWVGKSIQSLKQPFCIPTALIRGGQASLPKEDTILSADDLVVFSITTDAMQQFRAWWKSN